jgi:hypothetical protein
MAQILTILTDGPTLTLSEDVAMQCGLIQGMVDSGFSFPLELNLRGQDYPHESVAEVVKFLDLPESERKDVDLKVDNFSHIVDKPKSILYALKVASYLDAKDAVAAISRSIQRYYMALGFTPAQVLERLGHPKDLRFADGDRAKLYETFTFLAPKPAPTA